MDRTAPRIKTKKAQVSMEVKVITNWAKKFLPVPIINSKYLTNFNSHGLAKLGMK